MRPMMSKQLTLSATVAILAMAAFVLAAGQGSFTTDGAGQQAGNAPLIGFTASR